jgi:type I restriction enzyme M protein
MGQTSSIVAVIDQAMNLGRQAKTLADRAEAKLATHKALEDEAKTLKAVIKSTAARKDELVEQARFKISRDEARQVIVERLGTVLFDNYHQYLRADQRACIAAIENLWNKYAVTAKQIEAEREVAAQALQAFLVELGYE